MKVVDPFDRVCLVLEPSYMPHNICTAKAVLYHLMKGHGHGLDHLGNRITWESISCHKHDDDLNNQSYFAIQADQPVLRSAHNVWPLPTIFVSNHHFFYKKKNKGKDKFPSLYELYKKYRGVCQICLKKKQIYEFSKEHIFPKAKGGTLHDHNVTLTCKMCNSLKGDIYPYYNINGEKLKAKFFDTGFFMPHVSEIRDEWKDFLFVHVKGGTFGSDNSEGFEIVDK